GATGNLIDLAVKYTYFYFAGVPFLALTNYLIAIFRAKGDSKTPLIVLSLAGLVNVGLNLLFVLAFDMSVEGVALATAIANLLSFVVLLVKLRIDGDFSFHRLKTDKKSLKDIVLIGLPAAIQGAIISFSNILIQSSIVTVNNNVCPPDSTYQPVVNGCAAGSNLSAFVYTAQNAVYQGVITFTSQNMGANKPKRVYSIIGICCLLSTAFGASLAVGIFLCRVPLLALYGVPVGAAGSLEAIAFDAATVQLSFVCLPYFLCGIMEVGSGALRGMGKSTLSMILMLVGSCVLRVVWLLTVFPFKQTLEMVYICYPVTWILTSIAMFICTFVILKKKVKYGGNA
ncbi:MAG: polysaccharide biosynthesis C-terminal domain-containing protein, partial [Clostridia bacterium]|nr:polysaccharide biosynthesis C-terminal domain-containing protein [Clostridia bacterium]